MNRTYVEALNAPIVDGHYVEMDARDVVIDKSYSAELLDYCFKNFCETLNFYKSDLDSENYQYKITLGNKRCLIIFDVASLYHLFGLSKPALEQAVIINERLKKKYKRCPMDDGFRTYFSGIKMFDKLCNVFLTDAKEIKEHDCDEENETVGKLNWDKISYKLYCCLNIGELTYGDTIFYSNRDSLLFERKLYSESESDENVLLIEFIPDRYNKCIYYPKSIRIQKKTSTRSYIFGNDRRNYSLVKGLKKGFTAIVKERV